MTKRTVNTGAVKALSIDRPQRKAEPAPFPPMLLRVQDCCEALNMGRTALYSLFGSGVLPSVKIGKARMVKATDLEAFVASLTAGALDGRMV